MGGEKNYNGKEFLKTFFDSLNRIKDFGGEVILVDNGSTDESIEFIKDYSSNLDLLARLVHGEARGEPYSGQVAVAAVVLNRVKSSSFPITIAGVIFQKVAFDVVSDGQINMSPDSTSKKAAQDALNGWDPSYGAIYYFNPNTATNKWIWSRPMTITIGNHRFCK